MSAFYPDGRMVPRIGDEVFQQTRGAFGSPASVRGVVVRSRSGDLRVKILGGSSMFGGATRSRSTSLSPSWSVASDPFFAQREAARAASEQARHDSEDEHLRASIAGSIARGGRVLASWDGLKPGDSVVQHSRYGEPARRTISSIDPAYGPMSRNEYGTEVILGGPANVTFPNPPTRYSHKAHEFLSDIYGGIGQLMGMATPYRVTGRALMINAPVAGYMLDDAVKGTVVDRMAVQPGVRLQNRYNSVSGLIEVPLLTFLIEQEQLKPEPDLQRLERLFFMLKASLRRSIPAMAPAIKKMKANEAKMAEAVRELYPDLQDGEDPAERMLAELFAFPVETQPQPEPQETMA